MLLQLAVRSLQVNATRGWLCARNQYRGLTIVCKHTLFCSFIAEVCINRREDTL